VWQLHCEGVIPLVAISVWEFHSGDVRMSGAYSAVRGYSWVGLGLNVDLSAQAV
jgi:hypothetical protein